MQLEAAGNGDVSPLQDTAIFRVTPSGWKQLAREGDPARDSEGAEVPAARYQRFGDPIAGPEGKTAFAATVKGGSRDVREPERLVDRRK